MSSLFCCSLVSACAAVCRVHAASARLPLPPPLLRSDPRCCARSPFILLSFQPLLAPFPFFPNVFPTCYRAQRACIDAGCAPIPCRTSCAHRISLLHLAPSPARSPSFLAFISRFHVLLLLSHRINMLLTHSLLFCCCLMHSWPQIASAASLPPFPAAPLPSLRWIRVSPNRIRTPKPCSGALFRCSLYCCLLVSACACVCVSLAVSARSQISSRPPVRHFPSVAAAV